MALGETPPQRMRFGPFVVDLASGELERDGNPVPLRPLATKLLLRLVRAEGRLVSHEELRRELWGEAAIEWRTGLHQTVRQLRRALTDRPGSGAWVQTVPWRGYRLDPARLRSGAPASPEIDRPHRGLVSFGLGTIAGALGIPLAILVLCLLLAGC